MIGLKETKRVSIREFMRRSKEYLVEGEFMLTKYNRDYLKVLLMKVEGDAIRGGSRTGKSVPDYAGKATIKKEDVEVAPLAVGSPRKVCKVGGCFIVARADGYCEKHKVGPLTK